MTNRSLCHDISSGHFYPGYWDDLFIRLNKIQKKRFNFCVRVLCLVLLEFAAGLKHRSHSTSHSLQIIVLPFGK